MDNTKVTSLLGLAQKAGKVVSGESAVEKAVRSGKALLLLLASDTSESSKKSYKNLASYYEVPCYDILTKDELGQCIGKAHRAALVIVDKGFAKVLLQHLG